MHNSGMCPTKCQYRQKHVTTAPFHTLRGTPRARHLSKCLMWIARCRICQGTGYWTVAGSQFHPRQRDNGFDLLRSPPGRDMSGQNTSAIPMFRGHPPIQEHRTHNIIGHGTRYMLWKNAADAQRGTHKEFAQRWTLITPAWTAGVEP